MGKAHVGVDKVIYAVASFQLVVHFIKKPDCLFVKLFKSFVSVELLLNQFKECVTPLSFKVYPVNRPWVLFIGSIFMGDFFRDYEKISCLNNVFTFLY